MKLLPELWDRLFWWWGFWRWRPRAYAHNSELKKANAYARRLRATLAYIMKYAPGVREHHRDLLTGMVVALRTGIIMRRPTPRPGGPHLRQRVRGVRGKLVGRPALYEYRIEPKDPTKRVRISRLSDVAWTDDETPNVYAVNTRACRRHGGWVKERAA